MANEIQLNINFAVTKTSANLEFTARPNSKQIDMSGSKGASPGLIIATTEGVDVDLSQLAALGVAWWRNQSTTITVYLGIYDPDTGHFTPFAVAKPGEFWAIRLVDLNSSNFLPEYTGTGTGTVTGNNKYQVKTLSGTASVQFFAFED